MNENLETYSMTLQEERDYYCKCMRDLQQENKQLKEQLEYLRSNEYLNQVKWERTFNEELVKDLQQKIDKAIEYIKLGKTFDNEVIRKVVNKIQNDLLNILEDKEIEEIPLFEGTLEQLNNLSILGDKE